MTKPFVLPVAVPASGESAEIVIPGGVTIVTLQPRTTTAVQVSFLPNGSNTAGLFFSLLNGQGFTFEAPAGQRFEGWSMFLFSTAAQTVDVVYW